MMKTTDIEDLKKVYQGVKEAIQKRLDAFTLLWEKGSEEDIFKEFIFCLLTPQSKATSCWSCVETLVEKNVLWTSDAARIAEELNRARFKYKKAHYIVRAREQFSTNGTIAIKAKIARFKNGKDVREWLAQTIKGMGFKEASHFLRNIGRGENLAILDRHVLTTLKHHGVIKDTPSNLSKKTYLEIEETMQTFADEIKIPLSHLDLLIWYKTTGALFK